MALVDDAVCLPKQQLYRYPFTEDLLPNYHTRSMVGLLVDQEVLQHLMEQYLPRLHQHLISISVPTIIITLPWFLCIYTRVLSLDVRVICTFQMSKRLI